MIGCRRWTAGNQQTCSLVRRPAARTPGSASVSLDRRQCTEVALWCLSVAVSRWVSACRRVALSVRLSPCRAGCPSVAVSRWVSVCRRVALGVRLSPCRAGCPSVAVSCWVSVCRRVALGVCLPPSRSNSDGINKRRVPGGRRPDEQPPARWGREGRAGEGRKEGV